MEKWNELRNYLINELVNEVHTGVVENMINDILTKMDRLDIQHFKAYSDGTDYKR
jgi:hypothetical protein